MTLEFLSIKNRIVLPRSLLHGCNAQWQTAQIPIKLAHSSRHPYTHSPLIHVHAQRVSALRLTVKSSTALSQAPHGCWNCSWLMRLSLCPIRNAMAVQLKLLQG